MNAMTRILLVAVVGLSSMAFSVSGATGNISPVNRVVSPSGPT